MSKKDKSSRFASSLASISKPIQEDYENIIKKTKADGIEIEKIDIDKLVPAPKEWNFFRRISDMKMLEMMFSIMENGLFNPILAWEQGDDKYMILSGHNRVEAYNRIKDEYEMDEFQYIPSIVYRVDEIDEDKAQEIIIDTNYIQREEDLSILPLIVKHRKNYVERRKDKKGNTLMMVAKELSIGRTRAYKLNKIATELIPEVAELYYNKTLTQENVLKFSWYNEGVQKKIYDKFKDKINNDTVSALKNDMSESEISEVFRSKKVEKIAHVLYKIPQDDSDGFKEVANKYLEASKSRRKYVETMMKYLVMIDEEALTGIIEDIKIRVDGKKKRTRK